MKTVGIVCEYNPIHTGHIRQIEYARSMGAECIVCVMSGNYTQRGEFAIADKYSRALCAKASGADLILELPFPYSSMSGEFFARAAIHILGSIGVDTVCFGHECEDISTLYRAADIFDSQEFKDYLSPAINTGVAKSFFDVYSKVTGNECKLGSNDILGAYYILAAKKLFPDMKFLPIKRNGADYKETKLAENEYPSATAIRKLIKEKGIDALPDVYVNTATLEIFKKLNLCGLFPVSVDNISDDILTMLRMNTHRILTLRARDMSGGGDSILDDGGIVSRILSASLKCNHVNSLLDEVYCSKFTDSRVRRVLLYSLFGVSDIFKKNLPDYTNLLCASKVGREYLKNIRKTNTFNIVTKPADSPKDSPVYKVSRLADIMYTQSMPRKQDPQYFMLHSPYIEK